MPTRPVPDGTVTRAEAAKILGVREQQVTRLLAAGKLRRPTGRLDGRCWHHEVEALAAGRARRRRETERLLPEPPPILPMDQDATFVELMTAAEWRRAEPGEFVDAVGAAEILGVSVQYVGRLAAQGRLPWLPTGRLGGGPTRVYRRTQLEVIANARNGRRSRA